MEPPLRMAPEPMEQRSARRTGMLAQRARHTTRLGGSMARRTGQRMRASPGVRSRGSRGAGVILHFDAERPAHCFCLLCCDCLYRLLRQAAHRMRGPWHDRCLALLGA
eukprot:2998856-Pleurochrysis_carterae.AAC.2